MDEWVEDGWVNEYGGYAGQSTVGVGVGEGAGVGVDGLKRKKERKRKMLRTKGGKVRELGGSAHLLLFLPLFVSYGCWMCLLLWLLWNEVE